MTPAAPDAANRQPPNRGDWQCWRLNEQDPARAWTFRAYTTSPAFALKIRKILPLMVEPRRLGGRRVNLKINEWWQGFPRLRLVPNIRARVRD